MNKKGFINIIIAVIITAAIGGGVYYFANKKTNPVNPITTPSAIPSGWKTYQSKNQTYNFSISYPSDFVLSDTTAHALVSISFPDNYFPGTDFTYGSLDIYSNECPSVQSNDKVVIINGIQFKYSEDFKGSAQSGYNDFYRIYNTIGDSPCYRLQLVVEIDPNSTQTIFDREKAFSVLRQILNTFKLTK